MTTFLDGPATGASLMLYRAPILLRVVRDELGKIDALDDIDDKPKQTEEVFLYILTTHPVIAFVDGRDKNTGKRWGKRMQSGVYQLYGDPPPESVMRDNSTWLDWAEDNRSQIEDEYERLCENNQHKPNQQHKQ